MEDRIQEIYDQLGFAQPTQIQEQTFTLLQTDENVLGLAPTGSGKTLAYVLPLLQKTIPQAGTQLLVITVSQELAAQVTNVIRACLQKLQLELQVTPLGGGANIKRQQEKLKKHPEIVVGTPGRLLELTENKKLKLFKLKTAVLDEADALLKAENLAFCRQLLGHAPKEIQLAFFSATDNPVLHELPKWFGQKVKRVDVRSTDQTQGQVTHYYLTVPVRKRFDLLVKAGRKSNFKALVFFNQLETLAATAKRLKFAKIAIAVLDSEQRQTQRKQAIQEFMAGKTSLLLTTDLAARGLDLPQLPAVINYDLPLNLTAYIHRVGRTGRMGSDGIVVNLGNERSLRDLKKILRPTNYQLVLATLAYGKIIPLAQLKTAFQKATATKNKSLPSQAQDKANSSKEVAGSKKGGNLPGRHQQQRAMLKKRSKNRWSDQKNKGQRRH
jgi:superfamily II DNA/RNA helicase